MKINRRHIVHISDVVITTQENIPEDWKKVTVIALVVIETVNSAIEIERKYVISKERDGTIFNGKVWIEKAHTKLIEDNLVGKF